MRNVLTAWQFPYTRFTFLVKFERSSVMTNFSSLLRQHREAAGWTQKELAVHLGKSESYISLLEGGARLPSEVTVRMLARLLGADEQEWAFLACAAREIQRIYQRYPAQTSLLLIELEQRHAQWSQNSKITNDPVTLIQIGIDSKSGVTEVP
jgi:transcriptional regulator with XRE-family HTH domain